MRQAPLDVGLTFKVLGSITPGNHIKDYCALHNLCRAKNVNPSCVLVIFISLI